MQALRRGRILLIGSLAVTLSACGGGSTGPLTPAGPQLPQIAVGVSPAPINATFVRTTGNISTFRMAADVRLVESAGIAARVTQFSATITTRYSAQGVTGTSAATMTESALINIAPSGTATYTHTQEFGVGDDVESVTWRFTVAGVDPQGRSFTASSPVIDVQLAAVR